MSYPDYAAIAEKRNRTDAELFASVGLGWLASVCRRSADRIHDNVNTIIKKKS